MSVDALGSACSAGRAACLNARMDAAFDDPYVQALLIIVAWAAIMAVLVLWLVVGDDP